MTRLLLINPNTSAAVTQRLNDIAQLRPQLDVVALTASFGAPYISTEADCAIAAHAVLQAWRDAKRLYPSFDAVLIGCFGDPGLFALKEEAEIPVFGLAQASFAQANRVGAYGVLTGGRAWGPMLKRLALALPEGARLAGVETVELTGAQLAKDPQLAFECLRDAARLMCDRSTLQSLIVGGAGLAGFASLLQSEVDCPLIDSVEAALDAVCSLDPSTIHSAVPSKPSPP